jgi:hypothetical protein
MTERSPDDIARDADPDQPPGPVPDDERAGDKSAGDKSAGDKSAGDKSAGDKGDVPVDEPDLGDFEGNLNA